MLNLAERGLLDRRSRPIRVVAAGVVEQERTRGDARGEVRQSEVKQGTTRKAKGCRREWKGAQGVRLPDKSFPLSLALSRIWFSFFSFQGERRHLSILLFCMLVALVPSSLPACAPPLLLFSLLLSVGPSPRSYRASLTYSIRENRYCFIILQVIAICELWLDPLIRSLPHFSLYSVLFLLFFFSSFSLRLYVREIKMTL